jgi:hypothetical protein
MAVRAAGNRATKRLIMTLQEALARCDDPFNDLFLWTDVGGLRNFGDGADVLLWVLVESGSMRRMYVNTIIPFRDTRGVRQYVDRQCSCIRDNTRWFKLTPADESYALTTWCSGSRDDMMDWLIRKATPKEAT